MRVLALLIAFGVQSLAFAANPVVEMKTNVGVIVLELNAQKAPITVKNFLEYVDADGYAGAIFHRVISDFMIQAGGHFEDLRELEVSEAIYNEAANGLKNVTGTIAMAREDKIDSAQRQFFINTANNDFLDHSALSCTREAERKIEAARARGLNKPQTCKSYGYTVFGKVIEGMEVVRAIESEPTEPRGYHANVPITTIVVESISRREEAAQ